MERSFIVLKWYGSDLASPREVKLSFRPKEPPRLCIVVARHLLLLLNGEPFTTPVLIVLNLYNPLGAAAVPAQASVLRLPWCTVLFDLLRRAVSPSFDGSDIASSREGKLSFRPKEPEEVTISDVHHATELPVVLFQGIRTWPQSPKCCSQRWLQRRSSPSQNSRIKTCRMPDTTGCTQWYLCEGKIIASPRWNSCATFTSLPSTSSSVSKVPPSSGSDNMKSMVMQLPES